MPGIARYVPLAAFPSLFNKRQKREGTAIEEPPKNILILLSLNQSIFLFLKPFCFLS